MRVSLAFFSLLLAAPAQAASTVVWVESHEASAAALAESLQELAGPTRLLSLLMPATPSNDAAGQALAAAKLSWRQVRLENLTASLDQAERAMMTAPRAGDAARYAELLAYRAGAQAMNFDNDDARANLLRARALGLKNLPDELVNTLGALWEQVTAQPLQTVEVSLTTGAGARPWVNDAPHDRPTMPRLALGTHLFGATQPGHVPAWRWATISAVERRVTVMPQAPPQLAAVRPTLSAAARGDRNAADGLRRQLGVDNIILCTMALVANRYDARCVIHRSGAEPKAAVASFLPGEPLAAHAERLWANLGSDNSVTVRAPTATIPTWTSDRIVGWSSATLGLGALATSAWAWSQTRLLHEQFRNTQQASRGLPDLQAQGRGAAIMADATMGAGLLFSGGALYFLSRDASRRAAAEKLGGSR